MNLDLPRVQDFPVPQVQAVPFDLPKGSMPSHPRLYIPPAEEMEWSTPNPKVPRAAESEDEPSKRGSPPIVPPQNLEQNQPETPESGPSPVEVSEVTLPVLNIKVPVPGKEIVSTAAVTSGVSVGAAMSAQAILKRLQSVFKPLIKMVVKKINKLRNKPTYTWSRQRLIDRRVPNRGTSPK